jgi:predicted RNA-binding Zn ribbon-like protein
VEAARGRLMLKVTWEWIGLDAALDVANTVAVEKGVERDLLAADGEFERWAAAAARSPALAPDEAEAVVDARQRLLALREPIRQVIAATAAGEGPPRAAVAELNRVSRGSPIWVELGPDGRVHERARGRAADRLLARYARSAIAIAADGPARLRRCPAPSCGMFYRPTREDQRWCSVPCGTRARVARHYGRRVTS